MKYYKNETMEAQNKEIKKYLMTGKKLTALDALYHFSCFRLSARIYDLRSEGMAIEARTRQIMSGGKKKHVTEYYINGTQKD